MNANLFSCLPESGLQVDPYDRSGIETVIGRLAIEALTREVCLSLKPGLVSPTDCGSHRDMNFETFRRSLHSLRNYFPEITSLGMVGATFDTLRKCGLAAEMKMRNATGGINTHKGAIFSLGLLAAAAGRLTVKSVPLSAENVCLEVAKSWGAQIRASGDSAAQSHGVEMRRIYEAGGARAEAANGFPMARFVGLPAYRFAFRHTSSREQAAVHALFTLISQLEDTNLLWRGGASGLRFAKKRALDFLRLGGVLAPNWKARAQTIHLEFVARNLSPGGSADLLGVTLFLEAMSELSHANSGSI